MSKLSVSAAFIITLTLTSLAFILDDLLALALLSTLPLALTVKNIKKVKWVYLLLLISLIGVLVNALMFSNKGETIFLVFGLPVRWGAVIAFAKVSLKLLLIAGAGSWFILNYTPLEVARGLERELGLPKGVSFSVAYAFRVMPLLARDFKEIQDMRVQRGRRRIPLTPMDLASMLTPLLRVGYERAFWTGVAVELRGFRLRRVKHKFKLFYRNGDLQEFLYAGAR